MKVLNVKRIDKGVLILKCDVEFEEWGLTIRECVVMNGKNGMWVSLPSRQYEQDGVKKYYNLVIFTKEKKQAFDEGVLRRLKDELTQGSSVNDSECPF